MFSLWSIDQYNNENKIFHESENPYELIDFAYKYMDKENDDIVTYDSRDFRANILIPEIYVNNKKLTNVFFCRKKS